MINKGFADTNNINTPNDVKKTEKPWDDKTPKKNRVDINVLKSKLQEIESKEFKKNFTIISILILALGTLGIYLSL